jgi:serine/threonine-protein kinase RsbW
MKTGIEFQQARLQDLESIHRWLDEFATQAALDDSIVFALRLAIEEVFVNIVEHGYKSMPGPIDIAVQTHANRVTVTIHDYAPPFPPDSVPRPRLDQDWARRPIGGLGWHFIREMMDEVRYASDPKNGNVLTLVKRFGLG